MSISNSNVEVTDVLGKFTPQRSNIIPILQQVQAKLGYLPKYAIRQIAEYTKVPEAEVYGVASFYSQFRFVPIGKNIFTVCRGTACHVRGSAQMLEGLERELGIPDGGTTDDLNFSIQTVACVGSCALAPLIVVNGKVHGGLNTAKVKQMIAELRKNGAKEGEKIAPEKTE